nr:MAG TPA: Quorum-sensing transcriptional activator-beta structure, pheromone binding protein [Caudoviricetes sp.]
MQKKIILPFRKERYFYTHNTERSDKNENRNPFR